jgi:broad specificity phosphatase PhoE
MPEARWAAVPEDRAAQWRRISQAVRGLLDRFASDPEAAVAVVTHQAPASVLVQAFCQWANPLDVRVHMDSGAISILEVDRDGRRHVVRLNWQPAPAG